MIEHEHPLNLIDLWLEKLQHEEEYEEDDEDEIITKQDFRCLCFQCREEITWFHRYYYTCCQCNLSFHKFCDNFPETLILCCHAHTLNLHQLETSICNVCKIVCFQSYRCYQCYNYKVCVKCAMKNKHLIYHPSHPHPLIRIIPKQILCECSACGKEHKGIFYICSVCYEMFLHSHCAFLPNKLQIQHTTNNFFSHIHPLTLAYSFPEEDQISKSNPRCRVCLEGFNPDLWIYKCEKCRYYAHLDCTTSRKEPFMSILTSPGTGKLIKNYEEADYPNLLHLPFPDPSYSLLKRLFFKENISITTIGGTKTHNISHQHPLILDRCTDHDITSSLASSSRIIKPISFHDPMKSIQLLCDGCVRPIITKPIYICANEDCNFVLHEWCTRLPFELKNHYSHRQHTRLILHSKSPDDFFEVFRCDICSIPCNGFVYLCEECGYKIDVHCAFIPEQITHASHPNHLLSRVLQETSIKNCRICGTYIETEHFSFSCHNCDNFHLHPWCALLIPETTRHKCDKHPMKLSYFPVENHKSEYFCEICEEELNPEATFYHCSECMQSMHTKCSHSILCYETHMGEDIFVSFVSLFNTVYEFTNVKFGGTYNYMSIHPHPLSFVQGIETDGDCTKCDYRLQCRMIFKCLDCEFAIDYYCLRRIG